MSPTKSTNQNLPEICAKIMTRSEGKGQEEWLQGVLYVGGQENDSIRNYTIRRLTFL